MLAQFARNWWVLAIRGVAALLFGIAAIFWPALTLQVLILLFGAYAFVDGIFAVIAGIQSGSEDAGVRWSLMLVGILGILAGIGTFFYPGMTAIVLLYFIVGWAILSGIFEIITAIRLRAYINEWWYILGGLASIVFGVIALIYPGVGAVSIVWIIGTYAIVFGIVLLVVAFRLRGTATNG